MSKFTKTNFILIFFIVVIAFVYPVFNEKVFYSHKTQEALSIAKIIVKKQEEKYLQHNNYMELKKGDISTLINKFDIQKQDIQYYDYSIYTTTNSYTIFVEPKVKYLKNREISPKIYKVYKKLNQPLKSEWI
jgi:ABC-type Fe3+/spermidine/putrescine transport system ATPase subunit